MACGGDADEELVHAAITLVQKDDGFSMETVPARRARELAAAYSEWSSKSDNAAAHRAFSKEHILEGCFGGSHASLKGRKEKMWETYFKIRSSELFKHKWVEFLAQFDGSNHHCPVFYQFVTDAIMEQLIKRNFPVEVNQVEEEVSLDYEEHNALRYTAGYVTRSLTTKIERSGNPLRKELILCLAEFTEESDGEHASEDWLNAIDRGGLKHVSDIVYMLFVAMELTLRKHLNRTNASALPELTGFTPTIASNDDVLFYWSMLSVNWEENVAEELLHMIIEHWITLRGFSLASSFMEKYKQLHKRHTQKSKGIRKQLQT